MNPEFQGPQNDKRRYLKLTADGSSVICEPFEAASMMDDPAEYVISEVWMTEKEYQALPEFMGF